VFLLLSSVKRKINSRAQYNLRAKGEYIISINDGIIDEIGFDNITDAILYAKDQKSITDARIDLIQKSTGETLQRIQ
jgi:hypothetical protein